MTITEAFGDWREFRNLEKQFKTKTIQEIIDEDEIVSLFKSFRAGTESIANFKVEWKKEEHARELIENLAENYAIDTDSVRWKIITNFHQDSDTSCTFCPEQGFYSISLVVGLENVKYFS
jgi:hypothetical protein